MVRVPSDFTKASLVSSRRWTDDWQGNATTEVPGQVEVWSYGDEVYGDIDTTERNAGMLRVSRIRSDTSIDAGSSSSWTTHAARGRTARRAWV